MGGGPHIGKSQIFFNGHPRGGALQGILKQTADVLAALVVRQAGDVPAVQNDAAGIRQEGSGNGTKEGAFACAVGAQNGDEVSLFQMEVDPGQGGLFVDGAPGKGFCNVGQLQHISSLPSGLPSERVGRWPGPR